MPKTEFFSHQGAWENKCSLLVIITFVFLSTWHVQKFRMPCKQPRLSNILNIPVCAPAALISPE